MLIYLKVKKTKPTNKISLHYFISVIFYILTFILFIFYYLQSKRSE